MSKEPAIVVDKETGLRGSWLRRAFYFKEGDKFRVDPKIASWVGGIAITALALVAILLKGNELYEVKADFDVQSLAIKKRNDIDLAKLQPVSDAPSKPRVTVNRARPKEESSEGNGSKRLQVFLRTPKAIIPSGSLLKAKLLTGASNGLVKAVTTEALTSSGETLMPAGTVLLGSAQSSEERLFVSFTEAVLKDGRSQTISAQACSTDDSLPGLKGSKVNAHASKFAANVALNFLSGMADSLQEKDVRGGLALNRPTPKNALLSGASKAAQEQARDGIGHFRDEATIIEVPAETDICVLFGAQTP